LHFDDRHNRIMGLRCQHMYAVVEDSFLWQTLKLLENPASSSTQLCLGRDRCDPTFGASIRSITGTSVRSGCPILLKRWSASIQLGKTGYPAFRHGRLSQSLASQTPHRVSRQVAWKRETVRASCGGECRILAGRRDSKETMARVVAV
jgi:hypothetical protein